MAAPCRHWSISPTASTASSRASCPSKKPWRWSEMDTAPRAAISLMFRTPWPISRRWASGIASSRSWLVSLCAECAAAQYGAGDEHQFVARLLDRQAEALAQHDPALGRQCHGQRVQGALARLGGQRRQLVLEPARDL